MSDFRPALDAIDGLLHHARLLAEALPRSRETSLVLTKIDEAIHWLRAVPVITSTPATTEPRAPDPEA